MRVDVALEETLDVAVVVRLEVPVDDTVVDSDDVAVLVTVVEGVVLLQLMKLPVRSWNMAISKALTNSVQFPVADALRKPAPVHKNSLGK